ncbi:MAG: hypothetical protein MN733_43240, partial [Nitrososphaera sp.]|nr:hypothetical protein [Nitrososphaera sp.]
MGVRDQNQQELETPRVSWEEWLGFYGVQNYDVGPETFQIEKVEALEQSMEKYGLRENNRMRLTVSKNPELSNIMSDGRTRMYGIYKMTIHGRKIPNLTYHKKFKGVEVPDLIFDSDPVSNDKDVYGLIYMYEELSRSKDERYRVKRQEYCIKGIIGDAPPKEGGVESWQSLVKQHGVYTADELLLRMYERWEDKQERKEDRARSKQAEEPQFND